MTICSAHEEKGREKGKRDETKKILVPGFFMSIVCGTLLHGLRKGKAGREFGGGKPRGSGSKPRGSGRGFGEPCGGREYRPLGGFPGGGVVPFARRTLASCGRKAGRCDGGRTQFGGGHGGDRFRRAHPRAEHRGHHCPEPGFGAYCTGYFGAARSAGDACGSGHTLSGGRYQQVFGLRRGDEAVHRGNRAQRSL